MKISLNDFLKIDKERLIGKVFAFSTDTVYGIGCLENDQVGINKIYQIKNRDLNKKLPVLIDSIDSVIDKVDIINPRTLKIIGENWPGALTIILKLKNSEETVAYRMPNSQIALSIIHKLGPLKVTSMNYSGSNPVNDSDKIAEEFTDIDYVIVDKEEISSVSSTIIDLTTTKIKVIRQGDIVIK